MRVTRIGVIGSGECSREAYLMAEEVGQRIAEKGGILICGGLGGVMEGAAKGAYKAGGIVIGILPGSSAIEANPYITIPIVTGMGLARNVVVVRSSEALIAIQGGYGTLSEMAFALQLGIPLVGLFTSFQDPRIIEARSPEEAVEKALGSIGALPISNTLRV